MYIFIRISSPGRKVQASFLQNSRPRKSLFNLDALLTQSASGLPSSPPRLSSQTVLSSSFSTLHLPLKFCMSHSPIIKVWRMAQKISASFNKYFCYLYAVYILFKHKILFLHIFHSLSQTIKLSKGCQDAQSHVIFQWNPYMIMYVYIYSIIKLYINKLNMDRVRNFHLKWSYF